MKVYTTDKIRNVVLLGHSGAGKTSLLESMAYIAKKTQHPGSIQNMSTISDFTKQEKERQISIHTAVVPLAWNDIKINFLDTPGSYDFIGETEEALSAADAAIIVVSGRCGIENGTIEAWNQCEKMNLPRFIFVTDMDMDEVSFREMILSLQMQFGKRIAPFHFPIRKDKKFTGYINVIANTANEWNADGEVTPCEIPDYSRENLTIYRTAVMEAVAETSEELLERYLNQEEFSEDEIRQALRVNIRDNAIVPVFMGANVCCQGMYTLMDDIQKYFPSPDQRTCSGILAASNEVFHADYDFSKPKSAYIFKTIMDPFMGKYSLIKVNSGVIKAEDKKILKK